MGGDPDSPRFESDKEDHPTALSAVEKAKERQDTINDLKKGLVPCPDGRKPTRAQTVSVGHNPADQEAAGTTSSGGGVGGNPVRSDKRAQTMPASSTRRADHQFDSTVWEKLKKEQETLHARIRRGSVTFAFERIPDPDLEEAWTKACKYHCHGVMTEGQVHGNERERIEYGKSPFKDKVFISCLKGSKGAKDSSPNQDNFSVTLFKNGWTLACAFDGHGPNGHHVSTRTVQTVPYYLLTKGGFDQTSVVESTIQDSLIQAFESAQKELVIYMLDNSHDVQASGSTAVAVLWKGKSIFTANAGDSRCVVGYRSPSSANYVHHETEDHKPITPGEKARIEASGGEVRSQTYPDGWVNHRIFIKGEDYPGLCMARTFGDQSVKEHGVIATPEVSSTTVDFSQHPFLVLSSDGVWEFLTSAFVMKAVAKKLKADGAEKTLEKLQKEAKKRWKQEEGDYCDDITSVLVILEDDDFAR